ncbi:MAG TPA: response regulator [Methylomirabilota bacterium]|nr:response regulator [Methylomirabilota bacterium]
MADLLRENGCQVIEAADGRAALSRIETEPIDLVLTDLAMPGASGWEVATACRERFPAAPIGLITGFGDQLEPAKIERHGVQFVVAKPFTSIELLREVSAALKAR